MRAEPILVALVVGCGGGAVGEAPSTIARTTPLTPTATSGSCAQIAGKRLDRLIAMERAVGKPDHAQLLADNPYLRDVMIWDCEHDPALTTVAIRACVAAADDGEQEQACSDGGGRRASAAELALRRLGTSLEAYYAEHATYPAGSAGPTPVASCCAQPDHTCAANVLDWSWAIWTDLAYVPDEPYAFQLQYQGGGPDATVVATVDHCDGTFDRYQLVMSVTDGAPGVAIKPIE